MTKADLMCENGQRAPFPDLGVEEGTGGRPGVTARGHGLLSCGLALQGTAIHPDREGTAGDRAEGGDPWAEEKVAGWETLESVTTLDSGALRAGPCKVGLR